MAILQDILASKRHEVERAKRRLPPAALAPLVAAAPAPRGFAAALRQSAAPRIIAEVKRASPSKGVLRPDDAPGTWRPEALAAAYARGGAAALSVLTDVHFFWGHPDALLACRDATSLPLLRKDFIVDPYQVEESRWLGADAILLIVRALDVATLQACAERARTLGMDVLVEVHDAAELDVALRLPDAIIGVNNRDLDTFTVDVQRAAHLRPRVPASRVMVAESGIDSPEHIRSLQAAGIDAFLIGEMLVRHADPATMLDDLRGR